MTNLAKTFAPWALLLAIAACKSGPDASEKGAPATQPSTQPAEGAASPPSASAQGTTPTDRDQVDADGVVRRGAALDDAEAMTVAEAYANAADLDGQTVKLAGTVDAVCAKKGCWMAVASDDGHRKVRVTFKDYGFFVPRESPGLHAVVQGELRVKTLDVETAQHYENDRVEGTGETPRTITEPQKEIAIVATGLELRKI